MLCLFKTHALGLFSDPGPVETKTALKTRTHCGLSPQSIWSSCNSSCCYTIHLQSTLLDATVGLVVFSFWWLQPVCFPKLLLGYCWEWDCAFFWMDLSFMMLLNTTVWCTPDCACNSVSDSSMNTMLPAQNWLVYRLNGSWAVCTALT